MAEKKTNKEKKGIKKTSFDPWDVLLYPEMTEKAIGVIERENKLIFIVNKKSNKHKIKNAIEKLFGVKVKKVETLIDRKGRKKAYITLAPEHSASDIATRLGML